MKKILILFLLIVIFSCKKEEKGFSDYLRSLDTLVLPQKFSLNSTMNSSNKHDSILFKKYKHRWTHAPYGIAFNNERIVGIIEYSIADNGLAPFLITFDNYGNKIDSLNILGNSSFSINGQTLESAILDVNLNLVVIDSSKSWQVGINENKIQNTTELKVSKTFYKIQKTGKIRKM